MDALDGRLVRRDSGLIQLLDPPFDKSALNPGYIKGYVPGVRENGGQYTHAAVWAAMAFAALGDGRRAWELAALINPLNHARTAEAVAIYKVEPYVIAADVYAVAAAHRPRRLDLVHGRGGLVLPADRGIAARIAARGRHAALCAVHARRLGAYALHYRFRRHALPRPIPCGSRRERHRPQSARSSTAVDMGDRGIPLVDDQAEHDVEVRVSAAPRKPVGVTHAD